MELHKIKTNLHDLVMLVRASRRRDRELIESSRTAIEESRALLYEIARRHPEIDFEGKPD